ncbi:bifunctional 3-demethylubiquinone-9 3-methyltransferase/ 2-octaprenyl-6-hydroxy phenol methylase [Halomonas elongata]|uniref:Bifunctional 3-demethylubiquinone-9 3-methyltransferase/ 2-octaprenyl-6-hydroxy phenol methylase n=1 Tax=Halomonas elongata TaxID=2746 RepID=A0A1B8P2P8_HALEL|nr:class I SAM-dependent methyltransferase [Halomonas elongata]OBX36524.1 bifunctional 3-demethylubiquinone-9 3-methyltransferase/ 2-octaprenyl-6-hydroxy phenol methylase [Halomonas elongata]
MDNDQCHDARIIESWHRNTTAWTDAVREKRIDSRRLVTDQAIIDAVMSHSPASILDVGCGEGWLSRELSARGCDVIGLDVVPELVESARLAGSGDFRVMPYEAINTEELGISVDAMVCNFSLLGNASVEKIFDVAPLLLRGGGILVVQTLHPAMACGDLPYQDGWREGSWEGLGAGFSDPAPWYFRTLESWLTLYMSKGFVLCEMREPIHPETRKPASIILVGKLA